MPPSSDHQRVLRALQERGVVRQTELADHLQLSAKTLQRLLHRIAYHRSLNHNSAFLTLAGTPRFDDDGLWTSAGVCFSRHGNLSLTLRSLIEHSPDGQTRQQLEGKLLTHVHNHLSRLLRQRAIGSFRLDRRTVYTSADPQRQHQQQTARRPPSPLPAIPSELPPGLDTVVVVRVLLRLLQTPTASDASLARALQAQHLDVTAEQVRRILTFYRVKKTTR